MEDDREFIEALPGDLRRIAEVAGLEAAVKIAREFRGTTLYVPDIVKQFRDEAIRLAYDRGETVRKLAMKHRITERTVRRIMKRPSLDLPEPVVNLLDDF
jgi:Mor family transcriptional regulator